MPSWSCRPGVGLCIHLPVPGVALPLHTPHVHVQRGEECRGAMPLTVVRAGGRVARGQGQGLLRTRPGLDLRLCVHREHQRMVGRRRVQPDDIPHLGRKVRIPGQCELPAAVRPPPRLAPDAVLLCLPVRRMMAPVPSPSAVARTMSARQTCFGGVLGFSTIAVRRGCSAGETGQDTPVRMGTPR